MYKLINIFLSLVVFFTVSCSDSSTNTSDSSPDYFEVFIDGQKWTADNTLQAVMLYDNLKITARKTDSQKGNERIEITFKSPTNGKTGVFVSNPVMGDWVTYQNDNIAPLMQVSKSGNYTITNYTSNSIEGTFSFSADKITESGTSEFTSGKFKVKF